MESTIGIRLANVRDRERLQRFHRALYAAAGFASSAVIHTMQRELERALDHEVATLLSDRNALVLVAELHERVDGYVVGRMSTFSGTNLRKGEIESWYVTPDVRGRGVGKALMESMIHRMREAGCRFIDSETRADNERARGMHEALGFREIHIRYRYATDG